MNSILRIQNLKYRYPSYPGLDFPQLLRGINLEIREGEFTVILGKPEAGKSTLFKIILSLIPRYTNGEISGKVLFKESSLFDLKPYDLIEKIGSVFQNPEEQIFTTSCESEIAFPLESLGLKRENITQRIDDALSITGIEYLRHRNPATLSGGEKKKLLIAALFALKPELWLLDEILDELDPGFAQQILEKLIKDKQTVLLFSSKMVDLINNFQSTIFVLENGQLTDTQKIDKKQLSNLLLKEGLIIDSSVPWNRNRSKKEFPPLVSISDIKYHYPQNNRFYLTVDNFHLKKGEIVAIAGKNGSGKSTLGKIIAGLKNIEEGELILETENNAPPGYLFQNPDYQIFLPTVKEELSMDIQLKQNQLENIIEKFSLPGGDVPPTLMSYGARKRLQGAVYYLLNRELYILDEADAGLSLKDFETLVESLYREDRGIIIISHNINLCARYSDRIYLMDKGKIIKTYSRDSYKQLHTWFNPETQIV